MADAPSATKPIFLAGLLGGLLGGVFAFAAIRTVTPVPPAKPEATTSSESVDDARAVTEVFMTSVRDGKIDNLAAAVKNGAWLITDQEYAEFLGQFNGDRARFAKQYGGPAGQFELVREVKLSPSLVRFIYLEKYQRDGLLWFFVVYHTMDGWRLVGVTWKEKLAVSVPGLD